MTIEEKRRKLFEQKVQLPDTVKWCGIQHKYMGENFWLADYAFGAFNAALDAVVIERPSLEYETHAEIKMRARFQDAIESTGLGLKVKP